MDPMTYPDPEVPIDLERAPCGCIVGTVADAFVIRPCSLLCPVYLYVLEESDRQGKPHQVVRET